MFRAYTEDWNAPRSTSRQEFGCWPERDTTPPLLMEMEDR